jgi:hypothetical protein
MLVLVNGMQCTGVDHIHSRHQNSLKRCPNFTGQMQREPFNQRWYISSFINFHAKETQFSSHCIVICVQGHRGALFSSLVLDTPRSEEEEEQFEPDASSVQLLGTHAWLLDTAPLRELSIVAEKKKATGLSSFSKERNIEHARAITSLGVRHRCPGSEEGSPLNATGNTKDLLSVELDSFDVRPSSAASDVKKGEKFQDAYMEVASLLGMISYHRIINT